MKEKSENTHVLTLSKNGEPAKAVYGFKRYDSAKAKFDALMLPGAMSGEASLDGHMIIEKLRGDIYVWTLQES